MRHIPHHVVNMCLWAVRDDGEIDEEMVDVILLHEHVTLLPDRRGDLTGLLRYAYGRLMAGASIR